MCTSADVEQLLKFRKKQLFHKYQKFKLKSNVYALQPTVI